MYPPYDAKLKELDRSLESLLAGLEGFSHQDLNAKPSEKAWSAMQVMQHLVAAEKLSIWYVRKKTSYPDTLKSAGPGSWIRKKTLRILLAAPIKFKAPAMVSEEKFPLEADLKTVAAEWRRVRSDLSDLLENTPSGWRNKLVYRHAVAGRLTMGGMLAFFDNHFNRHRKQIERTLQSVGTKSTSQQSLRS